MPEFEIDNLIVEESKISDYLLDLEHRIGGAKARFFMGFGFDASRPVEFAECLKSHAASNPVVSVGDTGYGTKWVVEGPITCPDGRSPGIRTVWILDSGREFPRLVSAYPLPSD